MPLVIGAAPAFAQSTDAVLAPVTVRGHYDNAVGSSDAASQGRIRQELLKSRPAQRPGEVLEFVPGVIVTQHSGDGKANQYFLRGFNLDHGTDFATWVDGMPVNMPSHGHGQGYSDLNFMLPELVERIDYRKGPYFARYGDFASAGSADIRYRRRLDQPFAQLTLGEHRYQRLVTAGSTLLGNGSMLLGAIELARNDGPWSLPERLKKVNGVLSLSDGSTARGWSATAMAYDASWNSTDQVPQRAVDRGQLGRFDAVDRSDGGNTSRYSLSGEWHEQSGRGGVRAFAYLMRYQLQLFSNFTYALERPASGDQFEQRDGRTVAGFQVAQDWEHSFFSLPSRTEVGLQLRHDRIDVGLFDTEARRRFATTREDEMRQTGGGLYAENHLEWTPWLRTVAGVRVDRYRFDVDSSLEANSGKTSATRVSPKLSAIFGPWAKTELFVNTGRGFHSNDARGTTAEVDPRSGEAADRVPGLVASAGWEIGARTQAVPGLQSSIAFWRLDSDSELVYVGDAGTTEANRPSRRSGIEWNNRWMPREWLLLDADLAWTRARFRGDDPAGDHIPGAVERVASLAVTVKDLGPWSASLQWRYLGPRSLIEDNTVRAPSTLLTNLRVARQFGQDTEVTLDVFNLLDRKANDIEYFYESRLPGEAAAVEDKHFHPAEPRSVRVTLRKQF
ncbi:TonB-dependent receptor [Aquabacterium sp. A7-Y]|uniref:TonB-dependent receptor n=1 Tax=Aquabacterium sp. A7-Y TaxID=1349605 RepID=UPI00223D47CC|nr:TonB-dependent receptor [Aquabacterium sp. A7-Y]MCW7536770.1 TonB-dependent receptor [Aquabacterium sp. A7-Y]